MAHDLTPATPQATGQRFMVSPCGNFGQHVSPADLVNYPGWTDCTDMSDEAFQCFVAERQAVRPYIVGLAV